jgi:DNA-binding protein Fis
MRIPLRFFALSSMLFLVSGGLAFAAESPVERMQRYARETSDPALKIWLGQLNKSLADAGQKPGAERALTFLGNVLQAAETEVPKHCARGDEMAALRTARAIFDLWALDCSFDVLKDEEEDKAIASLTKLYRGLDNAYVSDRYLSLLKQVSRTLRTSILEKQANGGQTKHADYFPLRQFLLGKTSDLKIDVK